MLQVLRVEESPIVIYSHNACLPEEREGVLVSGGMHDHVNFLRSLPALKLHRAVCAQLHWHASAPDVSAGPKGRAVMRPSRVLPGPGAQVHLRMHSFSQAC